jgi:hypothetical protein
LGVILGNGSNIEISGCKINLDSTLAKTLSVGTTHVGIYKPENSGTSANVKILNNTIAGAYNGILVHGGDETTYGNNWICDGNTVENVYWQSILVWYVDFISVSHNTIVSMATTSYTGSGWNGLTIVYSNAQTIQSNRIYGRYAASTPSGIYLGGLNLNTAPANIFNNEVILRKTGTSADQDAFGFLLSSGNIYHNSIALVTEASASRAAALYVDTDTLTNLMVNVRNNNFYTARSIPIYVNSKVTTLDYNNYFTASGTVLGVYNNVDAANLTAWKRFADRMPIRYLYVQSIPICSNLWKSLTVLFMFSVLFCRL